MSLGYLVQKFSISSRVFPFVSGTYLLKNIVARRHIQQEVKKPPPIPILSIYQGNVKAVKKLAPQLVNVTIDIAEPLILLGKFHQLIPILPH